jgi:hypothetical protein
MNDTGTSNLRSPASTGSAKHRLGRTLSQIAQGWFAWVSLGAVAGTLVFAPPIGKADEPAAADPSGVEIERAVAEAERRGEAARASSYRP